MTGIKEIWIEAEEWAEGEWNYENCNTGVSVILENGEEYGATFFTYSNIEELTNKNKVTRECLNGKYFWAACMIFIDKCSRNDIEIVIKKLFSDNELTKMFCGP